MKQYKLIKEYPGSPKLGTICEPNGFNVIFSSVTLYNIDKYSEFWEEIIPKDYEILSIKSKISGKVRDLNKGGVFANFDDYEIYSVKRLSDNEVFTIGDNIEVYKNKSHKINSFKIKDCRIEVGYLYPDEYFYYLTQLKKAKVKLFTTTDLVDIYDKETYYYPVHKSSYHLEVKCNNYHCTSDDKFWIFSTKEAAEDYIIMHKPCLSLKEILDILRQPLYHNHTNKRYEEYLTKYTKSKL